MNHYIIYHEETENAANWTMAHAFLALRILFCIQWKLSFIRTSYNFFVSYTAILCFCAFPFVQ